MQNITECIKWSETDLTAIEEFYDLPPALLEADRAALDLCGEPFARLDAGGRS